MNIQIEGRHLQITEAIQSYVEKKVGRLDKFFDGVHHIRVILSVSDPRRAEAEIICGLVRGQQVVAKAEHEDLYAAIDEAFHRSREIVAKFKERLRSHKSAGPRGLPEGAPEAGQEVASPE